MSNIESRAAPTVRARGHGAMIRLLLLAVAAWALLAWRPAAAHMEVRNVLVGDTTRSYLLHVPDRRERDGRALPLVVALHGGGSSAYLMQLYSGLNAIAEREQFAVAYPSGTRGWWNDGRMIDGRPETDADDIAFLRAVVADAIRTELIDKTRVFAAGISNGGFMSLRLACEATDLFAGIAAVAATMPEDLGARCRPAKPLAVLVINGTADGMVPYVGGYARTAYSLRGAIWSTERTAAFWARHNRCTDQPAVRVLPDLDPSDGSHVIEADFRGCAGAPVKLLRIEGGGHTWPGGVQIIPFMFGTTNRDIDAGETIWSFFKSAPAR